ncbi:hypothetical protein A7D00_7372 [Trichophyton violaceum]|uniref:Uncharacterized protein n=1 Tax=Trichophyton violaceum TaxID=34388 RepID=A0A178F8B9_TRIVO|nr:hypothetical protein A7D00_7372 [Trichophyton violaceum]
MCAKFEEHLLYQYDEETLVHHINGSKISPGSSSLFSLSQNLVAKRYSRGEESGPLIAIRRARQLGIPGSHPRRRLDLLKLAKVIAARHTITAIRSEDAELDLEDCWIPFRRKMQVYVVGYLLWPPTSRELRNHHGICAILV